MGVVEVALTRLYCIAEKMTERMKRLLSDALRLDCLLTSPPALPKPNRDMLGGSRPRNAPALARSQSGGQRFVFQPGSVGDTLPKAHRFVTRSCPK